MVACTSNAKTAPTNTVRPAAAASMVRNMEYLPNNRGISEAIGSWSLHRRAAEFLQAFAAFVPGGGVEDADGGQVIHFEAGNHLRPEPDLRHVTSVAPSPRGPFPPPGPTL